MYNFNGVAIECSTWSEMQQLAVIAEGMGYKADPDHYNEHDFAAGARYFALYTRTTYCNAGDVEPNEIATTFSQFINQPSPDDRVYGC